MRGAAAGLSATPAALALGLCSAAAALLVAGGGAPGAVATLAAPAVLLGPGLALLPRWSAGEPSLLKIGVVGWMLSPPLFAALLGGLTLVLPPDRALAGTLALVALGQLLAVGSRLGSAPPGAPALCAALAGPILGILVLWAYSQAPVLALWGDGLWWAGAAAEVGAGPPFEDPWLAGTPFAQAPGPALLLAGFARALGLEPSAALGLAVAWPLFALPLTLYFVAAPLWPEPRRASVATLLALVGGGAGAGLWSWVLGVPSAPLEGFAPLLRFLVGAPHGGPQALPLAPFGPVLVPGAATAAWGLSALGLLAGVHALRHGRRPWVGLTGLATGLTVCLDPALGAALGGAVALTALVAPGSPGVAPRVLAAVGAWGAAGFALQAGRVLRGAELVALGRPDPGLLAVCLGLPALGALLLLAPRVRAVPVPGGQGVARGGERRTLFVLLSVTGLLGGCLAWLDLPRGLLPGSSALLAQAAAGILAGGGLVGARAAPAPLRGLAGLVSALLVLGLVLGGARLAGAWGAVRSLHPLATMEEVLREEPYPGGPLGPAWSPGTRVADPEGLAADRALAWRSLAQRAGSIEPPPVLVLGETQEAQRLRHAPAPHPAPLLCGIPLWLDRSVPHTRDHPRHGARERAVRELYEERTALGHGLLGELSGLDRTAILWVDSADRERSGDLDSRLLRLGFQPLLEVGEVTLYRWTPPGAVAAGRAR